MRNNHRGAWAGAFLRRIGFVCVCAMCAGCATSGFVAAPAARTGMVSAAQLTTDVLSRYTFDTLDDIVRLYSAQGEIRLCLGSTRAYANGKLLQISQAPYYDKGVVMLPRDVEGLLRARMPVSVLPKFTIRTIVVDAGHGGKDPGAVSPFGTREKDINLKIARLLEEQLRSRGFHVVLTRSRDIFLTLQERVDVAKKAQADIFVSIHANAARSRSASGVELYYLTPQRLNSQQRALSIARHDGSLRGMPDESKVILWDLMLTKNYALSVEFASSLYQMFRNMSFKVKPPKKAPFYVLRLAYVPSVLVEAGYLTNRLEEKALKKTHYQKQIAEAVALGIVSLNKRYAYAASDE